MMDNLYQAQTDINLRIVKQHHLWFGDISDDLYDIVCVNACDKY